MLTQEMLKTYVHYDPDTGFMKMIKKNKVITTTNNNGYVQVHIARKQYQVHRLAWLYVYGTWPNGYIDHIDSNRVNNALNNLREATPSQNCQNMAKAHKDSKTGILGVSINKKSGKFYAQIKFNSKNTCIGYYDTATEAQEAYLAAKRVVHPFGEIAKVPA